MRRLGSEEVCSSERKALHNSNRVTVSSENAALPAESCSLHGHSHQPLGSPRASPIFISHKGSQLQLTKKLHAICTSFRLILSAKSRCSCGHPGHRGTRLSGFMEPFHQMGLMLLVFVLPLHPQTFLSPCPRQGPQLCPILSAYLYPHSFHIHLPQISTAKCYAF